MSTAGAPSPLGQPRPAASNVADRPTTPPDDRAIPEDQVDLRVDLGGLRMRNPITTASGCFASGPEVDRFFDIAELGAIVVKSITLEPREGLPAPRMAETPSGMLNAIGLQNPGVDRWIAKDLAWLRGKDLPVVVSIAGKTVDDYREVARRLRPVRASLAAVEVNISCPNVEDRNIVFACRAEPSAAVLQAVRRELDLPLFAKLTPDVTDVAAIARAVVEAGATGLSLINTTLGMAIDVETCRPTLANTFGGLSGPAIRPIAVRNIFQVHQAVPEAPIIGMGGVRTVEDAVELMLAGASAVAIGTANFLNPFATQEIIRGLRTWMARRGYRSPADLRGKAVPSR